MTAAVVRRMFRYNSWANARFLEAFSGVPAAAYAADLRSSYGGLHGTMVHIVWAHHLWLLRWLDRPNGEAAERARRADGLEGVRAYWSEVERGTSEFLDARLDESLLRSSFSMKTTKGAPHEHRYGEAMLHLINHSSYHRGQLAALMRQSGFPPPATDFIVYAREYPADADEA